MAVSAGWLRLARLARLLSWLTLAWMGVEGGVAIGAAIAAGSVALLGFGLDSGIEAMASVIVIWRFTGTRLAAEGVAIEAEPGAVCCYARQDKVWAHDPDGVAWEYYTVLEHIETP